MPARRRGADRAADPGTAPWRGSGSTARPPQYHCLSSSASARTARKYCWRSRTWVERAPRLGVLFSTIWSIAAYIARPSSSWTVRRGWKRQSPRFGTAYRFRGVRSTSTATYSPTRPTACTTRAGACFADFGHVVTCVDKDASKAAQSLRVAVAPRLLSTPS